MSDDYFEGIPWLPLNPYGITSSDTTPLKLFEAASGHIYRIDQMALNLNYHDLDVNQRSQLQWVPAGDYDAATAVVVASVGFQGFGGTLGFPFESVSRWDLPFKIYVVGLGTYWLVNGGGPFTTSYGAASITAMIGTGSWPTSGSPEFLLPNTAP